MGSFERRDWATAEAEARAALAHHPTDEHRLALMEALAAQARFDEVLATHDTVCAPTPRSLFLRAIALAELGRTAELDAALSDCWRALEANLVAGEDSDDLLLASRLTRLLGQDGLAAGLAQRALVLSPTSAPALTLLGQLLVGVDDALARRRLEQSLAIDPQQPAAWVTLSHLLLRAGDAPGARQKARRALDLAPQWTEAQKAFWHASLRARSPGAMALVLAPLAVSLALVFAAWNRWTEAAFWPLLGASFALFVVSIAVDVMARRARRKALATVDPVEARFGAGGTAVEELAAPSDARVLRGVGTALFGCAGLFALVGLGAVGVIAWSLQRQPFHLAMPVLGALPFVVAAMLWWEGRKARLTAARAARDRT